VLSLGVVVCTAVSPLSYLIEQKDAKDAKRTDLCDLRDLLLGVLYTTRAGTALRWVRPTCCPISFCLGSYRSFLAQDGEEHSQNHDGQNDEEDCEDMILPPSFCKVLLGPGVSRMILSGADK